MKTNRVHVVNSIDPTSDSMPLLVLYGTWCRTSAGALWSYTGPLVLKGPFGMASVCQIFLLPGLARATRCCSTLIQKIPCNYRVSGYINHEEVQNSRKSHKISCLADTNDLDDQVTYTITQVP